VDVTTSIRICHLPLHAHLNVTFWYNFSRHQCGLFAVGLLVKLMLKRWQTAGVAPSVLYGRSGKNKQK
jgi:hypothetical protein